MSSNKIEKMNNTNKMDKTKKIIILFILIFLFLMIFLTSIFSTVTKERKLPRLEIEKKELSVRGDIVSADNFKISSSKKLYKASLDTRFLDEDKKELFINLFSIYSNIPKKNIRKKFKNKKREGTLVLSYNIDSRTAKNLKELSYKLRSFGVFKRKKLNGITILRGLNIIESGEKRLYSYEDTLSPVIGYIRKFENKNTTKVRGEKGLEKSYDKELNQSKDGILKGTRDVLSYISFDKDSTISKRIDGANLNLNIPLKLQKNNELILDMYKKKLSADEIIVSIMESKTGKVITLASSNRFNPERIKQEDIPSLNVNAVEYQFEPGSVLKPIAISLVMDKNRIQKNELFNAYNKGKRNKKGEYPKGRYPIDRFTIKDDHRFKKRFLTLDDIVIYSSNIGTLQLAQRLSGPEFYEGYKRFGFTRKTGIDLPFEKKGRMKSLRQFSAGDRDKQDNIFKATVSYGQGITTTFMQILKAYSVFSNDGYASTPRIVNNLTYNNNNYSAYSDKNEKIISKRTANEMKRMLIKTVKVGTGKATNIEGLEIGGKTGTAQIPRSGGYGKEYISSFFGFVNDGERSYTIGVTVIKPNATGKHWYYYYASSSAVPVFKEIIENLVKLNYLIPKKDIISKN